MNWKYILYNSQHVRKRVQGSFGAILKMMMMMVMM